MFPAEYAMLSVNGKHGVSHETDKGDSQMGIDQVGLHVFSCAAHRFHLELMECRVASIDRDVAIHFSDGSMIYLCKDGEVETRWPPRPREVS